MVEDTRMQFDNLFKHNEEMKKENDTMSDKLLQLEEKIRELEFEKHNGQKTNIKL